MTTTAHDHDEWATVSSAPTRADEGFSLVELVFVIAILGILTAVVSLALSAATTEAADSGCLADQRNLQTSYGSYVAQTQQTAIAPTGTGHDRFERTLVQGGYLQYESEMHDLDASGAVIPEAVSAC